MNSSRNMLHLSLLCGSSLQITQLQNYSITQSLCAFHGLIPALSPGSVALQRRIASRPSPPADQVCNCSSDLRHATEYKIFGEHYILGGSAAEVQREQIA